jgi:sugar diacid utilization regulator
VSVETADVERTVERIAGRLGRGLSLEDLDGVLLAYSSHQSAADRVRVNFLLSKKVPDDVSRWQLQHGIAAAVRPVVIPANEGLGMLGRVCVPLLVRGFRVGYLWVQQNQEEVSATAVLRALPGVRDELDLLAALLLEGNTAESEHRRRREGTFLAGCASDPEALGELAGWPELELSAPWQVAVLLEDHGLPREDHDPQASILVHRSAALQATVGVKPALFSAGTPTHAVLLATAEAGRQTQRSVVQQYAAELAKRSGQPVPLVRLGLSEPFHDVRGLADAYRQGCRSVQAASVDPQLGVVAEYRDIGVYQLLATGGWQPADMRSVSFGELQEQDRNGELLPLLELLYDKNGSVQDIAAQLHLHRSSVYNRLARIRSVTGADPLGGPLRLELHLCLKALRWSRRPRL